MTIPNRVLKVSLAAALLLSTGSTGRKAVDLHKLDQVLQHAVTQGSGTLSVIIGVKPGERDSLRRALEAQGARLEAEHALINALTAQVQVGDLAALARNPVVESVSINADIKGSANGNGPNNNPTTSSVLRATLGLTDNSPTGAGITIAVVDSGFMVNSDFDTRLKAFYDQVGEEEYASGTAKATDGFGHGTHVAGLIGSNGNLSGGQFKGVAPGASFVGSRVLGSGGSGRTSDVLSQLQYATIYRARLGIDVINLSLGHPIYEAAATDPLVRAVEAACRAGIVVVVAAGNFGINADTGLPGYAGITSPGNAPCAISVGASNTQGTVRRSDDTVAPYSSSGPTWYDAYAKPDVVAPGHALVANVPTASYLYKNYPALRYSNGLMTLSGSSMAAAVTSGVVAVVLEANRVANPGKPRLTPNAVKAILQHTAVRLRDENGVEYDYLTQGAGSVNAAGAIALAQAIDTSTPAGSSWLTTSVSPYTTIGGELLSWAEVIVWGENIVWGAAVYTNEPAWAQNIVWGSNIVWGANIVWGSNIVWTDNIVWGNNIVWGANLIGTTAGNNIVWGSVGRTADKTVWGKLYDDNIVWGSAIVWPNLVLPR